MFLLFFAIFFFSIPAFILGMIAPRVYSRVFKNGVTRGKIAKLLGGVMLGSLILTVVTAPPAEPKPLTEIVPASEKQEEGIVPVIVESKIVKVVDGDTIKVETNGVAETIRIIGINTPETVDPRKPVECFGQEASDKAKEMLSGQIVRLEADQTQGERDKYGRLLRYVFLSDGLDFGKQMIVNGYAYEYTYSSAYKYQQEYKTAQAEAENDKRGLWADGKCEDVANDSMPTTDPAPSTDNPVTDPESTTTTSAQLSTPPVSATSCSCSSNLYNCKDFSTHASAQAVYDCCMEKVGSDVHKLDGSDKDGQVCETLP